MPTNINVMMLWKNLVIGGGVTQKIKITGNLSIFFKHLNNFFYRKTLYKENECVKNFFDYSDVFYLKEDTKEILNQSLQTIFSFSFILCFWQLKVLQKKFVHFTWFKCPDNTLIIVYPV